MITILHEFILFSFRRRIIEETKSNSTNSFWNCLFRIGNISFLQYFIPFSRPFQFIVSLVNILIARGEDFSHLPSFEKNLFGFYFSIRDIIMGIVYSLLLLPFTIVFPLIFTQIKSELEEYRLYRMRRFGREEGVRYNRQIR